MAYNLVDNNTGSIKLILGCMYSGKTSELLKDKDRWESIGIKTLIINFAGDNRYGDDSFVYSHSDKKAECIKVNKLEEVEQHFIDNNKIILINEGQFFCDLKHYVLEWCEKYKKHIVIAGLDGDFRREKFGEMLDLVMYANDVVKMKALCAMCKDGTDGLFSWRLSNETDQTVIGATNYIPVCRNHYIGLIKKT
jgi:thymidine kinase